MGRVFLPTSWPSHFFLTLGERERERERERESEREREREKQRVMLFNAWKRTMGRVYFPCSFLTGTLEAIGYRDSWRCGTVEWFSSNRF